MKILATNQGAEKGVLGNKDKSNSNNNNAIN